MKKILLLSILSIFVLSACEEGMGVNITLKSKDKEKDASSALSLDIDGKDIKVGTSSVESFVSNGKKSLLNQEIQSNSVPINQPKQLIQLTGHHYLNLGKVVA